MSGFKTHRQFQIVSDCYFTAENYLIFTEMVLTYSRSAMHLPINIDDVLNGQTVESERLEF